MAQTHQEGHAVGPGLCLAPPTKYTLAEEPISPGKYEPTGTKLQKNNHNKINKLHRLHEKEFKVMWRKTLLVFIIHMFGKIKGKTKGMNEVTAYMEKKNGVRTEPGVTVTKKDREDDSAQETRKPQLVR